jgi:hypothetical protein
MQINNPITDRIQSSPPQPKELALSSCNAVDGAVENVVQRKKKKIFVCL